MKELYTLPLLRNLLTFWTRKPSVDALMFKLIDPQSDIHSQQGKAQTTLGVEQKVFIGEPCHR